MSYSPYVTDKKNKPVVFEGGGKVIIRRFSEGDYRRFQAGLTQIARSTEGKKPGDGDMAAWEKMRDLVVAIGVASWNFVDENAAKINPAKIDNDKIDNVVFGRLRDEIIRHNPCLWIHINDADLGRLGLKDDAKNV